MTEMPNRPGLRVAPPSEPVLRDPDDLCAALGIRFSDQQLAAITAPLEPAVIMAGAGSGKTTVMAARVVWLVGTGVVRPEQILGLTFTRKAAAELATRIRSALLTSGAVTAAGIEDGGEQVILTYDAFAARLVAEHGLRIGVDADPRMITGATRYRLASRVVQAAPGPFEHLSRILPATVTDRVLRLDGDLQSHLVSAADLDRHAGEFRLALAQAPTRRGGQPYVSVVRAQARLAERLELARLVGQYQQLKRDLGLVEFADQMALAARLAREVPSVSATLRQTYPVVLLDEYQDTSAAQAQLLRGLFSGAPAEERPGAQPGGAGHPVTAVGDPFQAIYGWRGAAASNILQFADDFPAADGSPARRYGLTVNRRSGQSILEVANQVAASLKDPNLGDTDLVAPAEAGTGQVAGATFETWPEEIGWVADQIVAAHESERVSSWGEIAVLTRRNEDVGTAYAELSRREVPAEIVGLGGLLSLPEVGDVLSTLRLLDDVTANPDLVRLLSGARWRVGPADLALLGRRARQLAAERDRSPTRDLTDAVDRAVADVDPTEITCLLEALDDPGELGYSAAARDRFAALAHELARLRRQLGEPVLDLTRRVIATLGLDVELSATAEGQRVARSDQLAAFVDAVAAYVDVDGEASLTGLLAYLQAEIDSGNGLDQAVPSDADAVKLLTVHKAKGLEWPVVFLPALMQGIFPSERLTDNWITNPAVVPADLRGDADAIAQLRDVSNAGLTAFAADLKAEHAQAEDRLGYVAVTRAKRLLVGSGHYWRAQGVRPRTPSRYLRRILEEAERQGLLLAQADPPGPEAVNPLTVGADPVIWPAELDPEAWHRRRQAAEAVTASRRQAAEGGGYELSAEPLMLDEESLVAQWDADLTSLVSEARRRRRAADQAELPAGLTASQVLRLTHDPDGFAADLVRPMPSPPSRAAREGTRFHRWIERFYGQLALIDPEDVDDTPHQTDRSADPWPNADLEQRFRAGQFADRTPLVLEETFNILLGGRLVRGRMDAVFADLPADGPYRYQVVDWKTGRAERTDNLQLALYRLAWAQRVGVPTDQVDACFYLIAEDRLIRPARLPDVDELTTLVHQLTQR